MLKILTYEKIFPSAKLLRDKLSTILGIPIIVTSDPEKINGPFIRYGNSARTEKTEKFCLSLNSGRFVLIASNKLVFSNLMQKSGIYSPIYYKIQQPSDTLFPVVIRKTLKGFGGEGIIVCNNKEEYKMVYKEDYYWTKYIKTRFELRVHILGGVPVKLFKKQREEDLAEEEFPIRNNDRGYHFSNIPVERFPKIYEISKKLADIMVPLGGLFFSADIGWDTEEKKYFVFEVNSASGLNDNTAEIYAKFIAKELLDRNIVAENKLQVEGE